MSETSSDEAALLSRYRAGDLSALSELYVRCSPALHLYAHWATGDADQASDVVQEAFVRLLSFDPARLKDSVRALLHSIARNLVRDERRKAAVRGRSIPVLVARAAAAAPGPDAERVARAIDRLPDDQRETVILKIYGELTFSEIAELTDSAPGTAMSRYRYALERLGQWLEEKS